MSFKAGLIQLRSSRDIAANLMEASKLIRQAASQGATFISTPEMTNVFEPDRERLKAVVMTEAEDSSVQGFIELAAKLKVWLHLGSMALKGADGKLVNRTLLLNPKGEIVARYDKIHLFDVDLPNGDTYRESETYTGGTEAVKVDVPFCSLGLSICYDVRQPALYHALAKAGADVLLVPAAFTVPTGKAHWHVLLRARAIETGSYVIAAAQGGPHDSGRETWGHSKVVDPAQSVAARARIPALLHAREFTLSELKA
jgi:deaminated glutathione amidase